MFDFVAKHKRLLQILLALLIIPPFALWGIDSYQRMGINVGEVAHVGDVSISEAEFSAQLRSQQERMQQLLGRNYDPAIFDNVTARTELLENMIAQRLVTQYVIKSRMTVPAEAIQEIIMSTPAFQVDGKFSRERYLQVLRNERGERGEGMTAEMFDNSLRRDLLVQQLTSAVGDASLVARSVAKEWANLAGEKREVATAMLSATGFASQVKLTPEAIKAYYEANRSRFEIPEQVRVEYVVLDADALASADPVSAKDIEAAYEQRRAQYGTPEQRQASHILLTVKQGASDADKAKVRARAEELTAQARKNPAGFADLAKKNSDDPGSAEKGGDVGLFARGLVDKAFEDAAFAMKVGDISGPVESGFGFHVIRLTGIVPGKMKPLAEVRAEIEKELSKQRAGRRYAESAEQFSNLVYEQSDSLKPVAERFKLPVRDGGWITRSGGSKNPQLNHPRLLQSLFGDDALKNNRNTEAIELAQGVMISARVAEHKPAFQRPLEDVQAEVTRLLTQKEAASLAWKDGAARLEQLRKGAGTASFGSAKTLGRDGGESIPPALLEAAFKAGRDNLPAYAGVELPDGYALVRVSKVIAPTLDEAAEKNAQTELGRAMGSLELRAYVQALRDSAKVSINKKALEPKSNP